MSLTVSIQEFSWIDIILRDITIYTVGIAQLVSAPDCGSGGPGFESQYPPLGLYRIKMQAVSNIGLSPSGKAQDFDSCMHQFESG